MKAKVIWVDEDDRIWETERNLLIGLGFEVLSIPDATTALGILENNAIDKISLIILDVALLPGDDEIIFSEEATNRGVETGLILAERLFALNTEYGKRILFYSRLTKPDIVGKIKRIAGQIGAFYLRKGPETQGKYFIAWLKENKFIGTD
jgi:hypothetical protein